MPLSLSLSSFTHNSRSSPSVVSPFAFRVEHRHPSPKLPLPQSLPPTPQPSPLKKKRKNHGPRSDSRRRLRDAPAPADAHGPQAHRRFRQSAYDHPPDPGKGRLGKSGGLACERGEGRIFTRGKMLPPSIDCLLLAALSLSVGRDPSADISVRFRVRFPLFFYARAKSTSS